MLGLAVLLMTSATLFWRRFDPVLRKILNAKPDANFSLAPVGPRVRDFLWEVLLQAKVIRQRPLPGLAHAFVFWGFCGFALVTLNHLAGGFGLGFLAPRDAYEWIAAGFAVCVAVSITGLFLRRFIARPKWLGEVSPESNVIAGLILILMATYLGEFYYGPDSGAAKPLWWAHTLTLAVFLPLIPHTKHLHLLLSPVTVFLSRGGFARIPAFKRRRGFRARHGQGCDADRGLAGLFLRGVRTLHGALPGGQYRQDSGPEANRAGDARVPE